MGSISTIMMRDKYPGKTDKEIAAEMAKNSGDLIILRYKNSPQSLDYDNFGSCSTSRELKGYRSSPYCHDVEILFDDRIAAKPRSQPLMNKTVSAICYIMKGISPVDDINEYIRESIKRNYKGNVNLEDNNYCIGKPIPWDSSWALEQAVYDYREKIKKHKIPDLGQVADLFQGKGPDGMRVVTLLFLTEENEHKFSQTNPLDSFDPEEYIRKKENSKDNLHMRPDSYSKLIDSLKSIPNLDINDPRLPPTIEKEPISFSDMIKKVEFYPKQCEFQGGKAIIEIHRDIFAYIATDSPVSRFEYEIAKIDNDSYIIWPFIHDG